MNYTDTAGKGSDKSPSSGMPAKNQSFENSGNQGNFTKGGQKKPGRKTSNGTVTGGEDMSTEKEYVEKKKKNEEDAAKEEEDEGWFRPSKNKDDETTTTDSKPKKNSGEGFNEIGRASCRERV